MPRLQSLLLSIALATGATLAHADAVDDATTAIKAMRAGNAEEAIRYFSKALATNELPANDRAMVLVMRGNTWYRGGNVDKAIVDFSDAIKANPQMADAYNNRANAWYQKGDYDRALADFDEAIALKPSVSSYRNRGDTWQMKKDYNRAIADYDRALRLDPNDATARDNREGAVSRRASAGAANTAQASGSGSGNGNCKANEELVAKLKALGATNIQIEGCADAKPGQGQAAQQAAQSQPAGGGLELPPPDMGKPMPFAESPGYYTNGITAQAIGNFVKSAQAFHAGALLGDPGCALQLAVQYEYGQGVPKDRKLANGWLEKSIEDERMLEQRALRYNFGMFLDMAKRGYMGAQWAAGVAYAEGNDGQKPSGSMEQARFWLGKAAGQGYARASATLADINRPPPSSSVTVAAKWEEPDYMKRAAAARKAQNAANCERRAKGAMVFCDSSSR